MNWKKIDNENRIQPTSGEYQDWKQQISDDCHNRCVYCSIEENPWGGIDHFHIEHFKPQSKFTALKNTITNLYHACPICNRFKSDDWPTDSNLDEISYPDPGQHDYSDLFEFKMSSFELVGKYKASKYIVNRLYLNRPQLIYERREQVLKLKAEILIEEVRKSVSKISDNDLKDLAFDTICNLIQHLHIRSNIPPYRLVDIKKYAK